MDPERRAYIERAAQILHLPLSEFVRGAAEERAAEVLRAYEHETRVSPEFFEQLVDALDSPYEPNEPLRRAFRRARENVVRD